MTQAARCDAVDFNGAQCGLQAGHSGQHGAVIATKAGTSFGRILATPVILIIAALLIGSLTGYTLASARGTGSVKTPNDTSGSNFAA